MSYQILRDNLLANQSVSYWLKDAIRAADRRDPIDAANDADTLARIMEQRAQELTGKG